MRASSLALAGMLLLGAMLTVQAHGLNRLRPRNDRSPYGSVDVPESALHRLVGTVVGTSNDYPIEGASVHVVRASGLKVHTVRLERSNKFDFSFDAVPGGYFVQAYVDGYTMGQTYVELTADDLRNDVVVRLTPWTIHGTVHQSDVSTQIFYNRRLLNRDGPGIGGPIPAGVMEGASVQLLQVDRHNILPPTPFGSPRMTGADGKFHFNVDNGYQLSSGHKYALEITSPAGWAFIAQLPVPALVKGQLSVKIDPVVLPYTISGQVRSADDGTGALGTSVQLMDGASAVGEPMVVDSDGMFKFNVLNGWTLDPTVPYTLDVTAPTQLLTWVSRTGVSVPAMIPEEPAVTVNPELVLACHPGGAWSTIYSQCLCNLGYEGRWCEDSPPGCYIDTDIMYLALTPRVQSVIEEHSISDATPFTLALPKTDVGEDITCTNSDASASTCVVTMVPLMLKYVRKGDAILVVPNNNKVQLKTVLTLGHNPEEYQTIDIVTVNYRKLDGSTGFIDLTANHMLHVRTPVGSVGDAFEAGTGAMDFYGYTGALSDSHLQAASTMEAGQQIWIQEFPIQSAGLAAECSASPASAACVTGAALPVFRAAEVVSVVASVRSVVVQEPIVLDTSIMVVNGMVASMMVVDLAYLYGLIRNYPALRTHFVADPLWAYQALEQAIVDQAAITPEWIDVTVMFRNMFKGIMLAHQQWLAAQQAS